MCVRDSPISVRRQADHGIPVSFAPFVRKRTPFLSAYWSSEVAGTTQDVTYPDDRNRALEHSGG
jgi:hypothetical protein